MIGIASIFGSTLISLYSHYDFLNLPKELYIKLVILSLVYNTVCNSFMVLIVALSSVMRKEVK